MIASFFCLSLAPFVFLGALQGKQKSSKFRTYCNVVNRVCQFCNFKLPGGEKEALSRSLAFQCHTF